ncbi:hypothetical protein [Streptomyces sp. RTd22]|uniref:hypothetical protein n=1 Tax=Streptomyces sp. RTd22 TaxID=1841249 RepID=UPI0007C4F22E|nr:hypothetical protein [Streptomyces sp. RTd22]
MEPTPYARELAGQIAGPLDALASLEDGGATAAPVHLAGPSELLCVRLDVLHAWLVEDLPGGRVRVLTQETQIGQPAAEVAGQTPNPMLNGHQAWLDGLVRAASGGA